MRHRPDPLDLLASIWVISMMISTPILIGLGLWKVWELVR